jgi:glycoprotein endo-alpha-1,2-mannosidase
MRIFTFIFITIILVSCQTEENTLTEKSLNNDELNYKVHTFYYNWYGNPEQDGKYYHWAHDVLPHWSDTSWDNAESFMGGDNIGANFYPQLGCYSSNDPKVISAHMKMIKQSGIGVLCLSWWGEGSFEDKSVKLILDLADKEGIKVNFHLEPLKDRNANSTVEMMKYIIDTYGEYNAFYYMDGKPMFYVYDSYLTPKKEWAAVFHPDSSATIRGTKYDAVVIGLWVNEGEEDFFLQSGFDGFYTYFASDGFTYGSSTTNWKYLLDWATTNNKLFIPCVGPGYSDARIRPWNKQNFKSRANGKYYDDMFESAIGVSPNFIGITSFNEWHEGTQIEVAIEKKIDTYQYENYLPLEPDYYLQRTQYWAKKFNYD